MNTAMLHIRRISLLAAVSAATAFAQAPGKAAPDFAGNDVAGKAVKLSDTAASTSSSSGRTLTARSCATITASAECRRSRSAGAARTSCG